MPENNSKKRVALTINDVVVEVSEEDATRLTSQPQKLFEVRCIEGEIYIVMAKDEQEAYDRVIIESWQSDHSDNLKPIPFSEKVVIEHDSGMTRILASSAGIKDKEITQRDYDLWKREHKGIKPHEVKQW